MSHFGNVFCSQCETFVFREDWRRHCAIEHDMLSFECDHCHYLYSKKNDFDLHVARKHAGPWFKCNNCNVRYTTPGGFKRHKCNPFSRHVPVTPASDAVPDDAGFHKDPVHDNVVSKNAIFVKGFDLAKDSDLVSGTLKNQEEQLDGDVGDPIDF